MRIINTYREPVPPEHVLTEAEILSLCCEVVPVDECSEVGRVGVYDGADQEHRNFDEDEALARARAQYPKARILGVRVEGIGPPPGTPCGKLYESWEGRNNCCEDVPALVWNMDITPDVLPHGGSVVIAWNGSDSRQVEISTSSNATWFSDGRRTAIGYGSSIQLSSGDTFCGNTAVTINDGCSSATVILRSDLGQWLNRGPICGLSGVTAELISGSTIFQAISGKYKMVETIELARWEVNGLGCDYGGGLTPAAGFEDSCHSGDCPTWYCEKISAARPEDAVMDVCLDYNLASMITGGVYCTLPGGAIAHEYGQTLYNCVWTNGSSGGGSKPSCAGSYLKSKSKTLYEWSC